MLVGSYLGTCENKSEKLYTLPETVHILLSEKLAEEHAMIDGKGSFHLQSTNKVKDAR